MSTKTANPFLCHFFESRGDGGLSALGTETFTKTIEDKDSDISSRTRGGRSANHGILYGTETFTEAREERDEDERRSTHILLSEGTKTRTATREDDDTDEHHQRGASTECSALGTQTGTRAREEPDEDPQPNHSLWVASVL